MFAFKVGENEYKVRFSVSQFSETDLVDRVKWIMDQMGAKEVDEAKLTDEEREEEDRKSVDRIKAMASCLVDLVYLGCERDNPLESRKEAGYLIDDYLSENREAGIGTIELFGMFVKELTEEGFLGGLFEVAEQTIKKPQDHKKKS